jgi:hypothetical protein
VPYVSATPAIVTVPVNDAPTAVKTPPAVTPPERTTLVPVSAPVKEMPVLSSFESFVCPATSSAQPVVDPSVTPMVSMVESSFIVVPVMTDVA